MAQSVLAAAGFLMALGAGFGCEAQVDGDYLGQPLARIAGRIESEAVSLPEELAIAVSWEAEPWNRRLGTVLPVSPRFPAEYSVEVYRRPPAEQLGDQLGDGRVLIANGGLVLVDRARLDDGEDGVLPLDAVVASVDSPRRRLRLVYSNVAADVNGTSYAAGYQVRIEEVVGRTDGPCAVECVDDYVRFSGETEVMACCLCSLTEDFRSASIAETSFDLAIARDLTWFDPWAIDNERERTVCEAELAAPQAGPGRPAERVPP